MLGRGPWPLPVHIALVDMPLCRELALFRRSDGVPCVLASCVGGGVGVLGPSNDVMLLITAPDFDCANNKTINEAKQMQVRIRKGKQGKYALTHINYDITHGHLEVWTQSANTADANSDSRDDKARKAKEDT